MAPAQWKEKLGSPKKVCPREVAEEWEDGEGQRARKRAVAITGCSKRPFFTGVREK